jgi:pyruvate dehydrogenase E2 component (dihydrolipoamide acetyltransferase)
MIDFLLPSLGADMDVAKLNCWLVKPGDTVHKGQIIAEVETEKATLEVECWHDGVIEELLVEPGPARLPVGTLLARIRSLDEAAEPVAPLQREPAPELVTAAPAVPMHKVSGQPPPPVRHLAHELGVDLAALGGSGIDGAITRDDVRRAARAPAPEAPEPFVSRPTRVRATPRARSLARSRGIDLAGLPATGPQGMVSAGDVERTAPSPETIEEPDDKVSAMRRAIARSMSHSKREIPHYYLATTIDLDRSMKWLEAANEERSVTQRILPAALLIKATALAAREVPEVNGHWVGDGFAPSQSVHLGVAISIREGGLVAPALHDADRLSLDELMSRLRDLVSRARSWRLKSSEMSDPTITVTNLGDRGVDTAFPVIIPPQVAMVGFGKVIDSPVAVDGAVVVHPVVTASLAADHRVTDGHKGGLFLTSIDRLLQEPENL